MTDDIEVTVTHVTRLKNSRDGNPRFTLHTSSGSVETAPDVMCAFLISDGWRDKRVRLTLSPVRQVVGIEVLP